MNHALSSVALVTAILVPTLAGAQELGSKHDAVFSADRLMGITGTKVNDELANRRDDWTSMSFGWRSSPDGSPFDVPRFSFDYLPIEHLSIGGSIAYASNDVDGPPDSSALLLAARVGYLYSFGRVVGIWPRGGFTYHKQSIGNIDDKGFALSVECPFTFSPATHFAFHVGPTFDIDMFGERNTPVADADLTYRAFGVNAGILGWL
jgi:hypothetical protein